ncbi:PucR family transcriptional regulator [Burkholderia ubonensis]|uniref:PucR family transcriptional regulator n=1 Tax=Burkholderia ubonensis TaxID=101571 RepID=UPI002AC9C3D9|nr:helix-turn-helix domain-containing protein [Burkholderia ubonensis]
MTPVDVPVTSALMRDKVRALAADPSDVVARTYAALTRIGGYDGLTPAMRQDIMDSIEVSQRLWFESVSTGKFPSPGDLEGLQEFGRRRVHQGIPLSSLLRAFWVGPRELWRVCAELGSQHDALRDELLFVLSPYLMEYFDYMVQLISQAYLDEQYQQARWRESLRYQLHEIVFSHAADEEGFRKTIQALGLDHASPRIALAIECERLERGAMRSDRELDRIVLSVARHLACRKDDLVDVWHRDCLVIWAPCNPGESASASDRRVDACMTALLGGAGGIGTIGMGLSGSGAKGWATSADEAIRALNLGKHRGGDGPLHRFSDIVVGECIRSHDSALDYLLSLMQELSGEQDLILTLETFFANMQRRKVTAAALGVHPNTLDHRLERIENILGAKLDHAAWIAKLEIALKLQGAGERSR